MSGPFRRILVPVDFTSRSCAPLQYAFELATLNSAAVDLLHVVPGPGQLHAAANAYLGRPMPRASEAAIVAARRELLALADGCARHGIVPELVVESGDVASAIVRAAVERGVDLIVLGTRGHRGAAELVLGSVAHKVITCARCPVVTLREPVNEAARASHRE